MARKIERVWCDVAGRWSYETEQEVERVLGRVRTKRQRYGDARGTRRGLKIERRTYWHPACQGYHTTEMSKRTFNEMAVSAA